MGTTFSSMDRMHGRPTICIGKLADQAQQQWICILRVHHKGIALNERAIAIIYVCRHAEKLGANSQELLPNQIYSVSTVDKEFKNFVLAHRAFRVPGRSRQAARWH